MGSAFCMVRTAGQACSVFMHRSPEVLTLYISKSYLDAKDKELATELQKLVESGAATASTEEQETTSFSKFQVEFLEIVVKHCSGKILELCKNLRQSGLDEVFQKASSPSAFTTKDVKEALAGERNFEEKRVGDNMLLDFCGLLENGGGVAEGVRMALEVITQFIDSAAESGEALCALSTFCHCLGTSFIARWMLHKTIQDDFQEESLFRSLIDLGRYARGAERLQQRLQDPDFSKLPKLRLIYAPPRAKKVTWSASAREVLSSVQEKAGSLIRTSGLGSTEELADSLPWVQSAKIKMHVELALILYLRELGLKGGDIGVSRPCCGICWKTVEALNNTHNEHWNIYGEHGGRVCSTLPTGIEDVDKKVARQITNALALLIDAHLAAQSAKSKATANGTAVNGTSPDPALEKLQTLMSSYKFGSEGPLGSKSSFTSTNGTTRTNGINGTHGANGVNGANGLGASAFSYARAVAPIAGGGETVYMTESEKGQPAAATEDPRSQPKKTGSQPWIEVTYKRNPPPQKKGRKNRPARKTAEV